MRRRTFYVTPTLISQLPHHKVGSSGPLIIFLRHSLGLPLLKIARALFLAASHYHAEALRYELGWRSLDPPLIYLVPIPSGRASQSSCFAAAAACSVDEESSKHNKHTAGKREEAMETIHLRFDTPRRDTHDHSQDKNKNLSCS